MKPSGPMEHRTMRELWRAFDDDELRDKAEELSLAWIEHGVVETARAEAARMFHERLKTLRGRISQLSQQIRAKGSERPTWCLVRFHTPANGTKSIFRADSGELVAEEPMTPEELQQNLFREPGEDQAKGASA